MLTQNYVKGGIGRQIADSGSLLPDFAAKGGIGGRIADSGSLPDGMEEERVCAVL